MKVGRREGEKGGKGEWGEMIKMCLGNVAEQLIWEISE